MHNFIITVVFAHNPYFDIPEHARLELGKPKLSLNLGDDVRVKKSFYRHRGRFNKQLVTSGISQRLIQGWILIKMLLMTSAIRWSGLSTSLKLIPKGDATGVLDIESSFEEKD